MASTDAREWTLSDLEAAYAEAPPPVGERVGALLACVATNGRLMTIATAGPSFGVMTDDGDRVLSVREHRATSRVGTLSYFPWHVVTSSNGHDRPFFEDAFAELELPTPDPNEKLPGHLDLGKLDTITEHQFQGLLEFLEKLGPLADQGSAVSPSPSRANVTTTPTADPIPAAPSPRLQFDGLRFSDETIANYILALQCKRFVILSGISGTGKTQLALAVARHFQPSNGAPPEKQDGAELRHGRIIAVRPDWTDNRGLLGFFNPILDEYSSTEFLDLLLAAREDEKLALVESRAPAPYFVILDEMNLARVEHYFSDFLSAMESGEPIELHGNLALEERDPEAGRAIPRRITVPSNLFFTGTVNVDETTYMFSPKVLDRAFTLEFNEVDLKGFGSRPMERTPEPNDALRLREIPESLQLASKPGSEHWDHLGELVSGELRRTVIALHTMLEDHGRHFGYRVVNEISRFVSLAHEQAEGGDEMLWAALDLAVLQKVLPKFHGTQQELEEVLRAVFAFSINANAADAPQEVDEIAAGWVVRGGRLVSARPGEQMPEPRLPRTAIKVRRMLDRLRRQGFTSFIE